MSHSQRASLKLVACALGYIQAKQKSGAKGAAFFDLGIIRSNEII
jgi:hypothetical protein